MKHCAISCYLNAIAAVAGAAGILLTVLSSTATADNALRGLGLTVAAGAAAVALVLLAIWMPTRKGNHDPISAVSVVAAIALFTYVFGQVVSQRIMLIAGLFSFNAGNTAGWGVFRLVVAASVCLLAANLLLVVGSFNRSVK